MNYFFHFLSIWLVGNVDHNGCTVVVWRLGWQNSQCLLMRGNVLQGLVCYCCNFSYFRIIRMDLRIINQFIDTKSVHWMRG